MQSLPVATRSLLQDFKAVRAGFDGTITKIQTSHLGHHYSSSQRQRCFTKLTGIDNIKNAIPLIRGWNIHQSQRYSKQIVFCFCLSFCYYSVYLLNNRI